jgi:hypothetical protein
MNVEFFSDDFEHRDEVFRRATDNGEIIQIFKLTNDHVLDLQNFQTLCQSQNNITLVLDEFLSYNDIEPFANIADAANCFWHIRDNSDDEDNHEPFIF